MSKLSDRLKEIAEREHKYHTTDYDGVIGVTEKDKQAIRQDLLELIKDVPTWVDASRSEWVSPKDIKKAIEEYTS